MNQLFAGNCGFLIANLVRSLLHAETMFLYGCARHVYLQLHREQPIYIDHCYRLSLLMCAAPQTINSAHLPAIPP